MRQIRLDRSTVALVLAMAALVLAAVGPAGASRPVTSAANSVAKTLKLAKQADKRSKRALKLAAAANAKSGPTGPQGPAASALDGAITTPKIADGAVTAAKLGDVVVRRADASLPDATGAVAQAQCHAGEKLVGGSARVNVIGAPDVTLDGSFPIMAGGVLPADGDTATGWWGDGSNNAGGYLATATVSAFALCVK